MNKNAFAIMWQLLKLVKPLTTVMIFTIISGVLGFLAAIFIMGLGAWGLTELLTTPATFHWPPIIYGLIALSLARALLRYAEQLSGHFIAFKLLALIRDQVFQALRKLAFVKLDNKQAGQLISMLTSDIELLEVFYAHTIAPVSIALITSCIMVVLLGFIAPAFAIIALLAYLTIGILLPLATAPSSRQEGRRYRYLVGDMTDYFLDSIRGMREILLFEQQQQRLDVIQQKSQALDATFQKIKTHEGRVRSWNEIAIYTFNILMLGAAIILYQSQKIDIQGLVVAVVLFMSSYGAVMALSNLSNNLLQTLASGERVLRLLAEAQNTQENTQGIHLNDIDCIQINHLSFGYHPNQPIIQQLHLHAHKGQIIGIYGKSGCGKSTLLKLIMGFFPPTHGQILINQHDIHTINQQSLIKNIAYMTQQTYIFNESLYENIFMARRDASEAEVIESAKKAGIHNFIMSLPQGYQTPIHELGQNLSDGEKQRIGIARAFLSQAPVILLDEPTSNLDSLNEALILNTLRQEKNDKIMILVSHRASTMGICDKIITMQPTRQS